MKTRQDLFDALSAVLVDYMDNVSHCYHDEIRCQLKFYDEPATHCVYEFNDGIDNFTALVGDDE